MQSNFWAGSKNLDQHKTFWDLKKDKAIIIIMKNYCVIRTFAYHLKNDFNANMSLHWAKLFAAFIAIHKEFLHKIEIPIEILEECDVFVY